MKYIIIGKMRRMFFSLLFTTALSLSAQNGEIGMKAPVLEGLEYVKGELIDFKSGKGNIYIIEFWATWCAPCKYAIPVLTRLQKEYKNKQVRIIGISDEEKSTVVPFVDRMGTRMDYTIAVSQGDAIHKKYLDTFGSKGIPRAFIVNQNNQIIWEGNPMGGMKEV